MPFITSLSIKYRLPPHKVFQQIDAEMFAGFSIDAASTVEALKNSTLPLLIAHGEDDDFVPCWMGVKSFEAAASPDKQLITVPGAGHGMSYLVQQEKMQAALEAFLDKLCPKK